MIIGLVGRARSGKDTVASILQELYSSASSASSASAPPFAIVRLSAPIKEAARALFQFTDNQIEGSEKELVDTRWNVTPRHVFQTITDITMAAMGTDFFTRVLYDRYDRGLLGSHIIIPDIRYEHDIREIQKRKGIVFKIERQELPVRYDCENHLDNFTSADGLIVISNDSDLETLRETVRHQSKRIL